MNPVAKRVEFSEILTTLILTRITKLIKTMSRLLQILLLILLTHTATAENISANYGEIVVDKVTDIYDGDSFKVNINEWPAIIGKEVIIRVKGIDAPEIHGSCEKEILMAKLARQHTVNLINKAFRVELKNMQRDQYFRILADVYVDRTNLGNSLVTNKYAVRYTGGKKHNWCNEFPVQAIDIWNKDHRQ